MYPTSTLTQLRVIIGTGALLAITAVLALALGTALRRSASAVTAAIALIIVPYILAVASALPTGVSGPVFDPNASRRQRGGPGISTPGRKPRLSVREQAVTLPRCRTPEPDPNAGPDPPMDQATTLKRRKAWTPKS